MKSSIFSIYFFPRSWKIFFCDTHHSKRAVGVGRSEGTGKRGLAVAREGNKSVGICSSIDRGVVQPGAKRSGLGIRSSVKRAEGKRDCGEDTRAGGKDTRSSVKRSETEGKRDGGEDTRAGGEGTRSSVKRAEGKRGGAKRRTGEGDRGEGKSRREPDLTVIDGFETEDLGSLSQRQT